MMQQTFEHLLGLPTQVALALLATAGIRDVVVKPTAAPPRKNPTPQEALRSPAGEAQGYASTRVVAVQEDGRLLVVSRFLVDSPTLGQAPPPEGDSSPSSSPQSPSGKEHP